MKNIKIALIHCTRSTNYKLVKMTKEMDQNDPCVIWVFDSSKLKMAKKLVKNMNIASVLNKSDEPVALTA